MFSLLGINKFLAAPLVAVLVMASTFTSAYAGSSAAPSFAPSCSSERGRPADKPVPEGQLVRRGVVGSIVGINEESGIYTRTEAQFFLMRILGGEENDLIGALQLAEYLSKTFPDNAYFHRYYSRLLYNTGRFRQAEKECLDIIAKIDSGMVGYEATSGRYAGFFLGQIYQGFKLKEMSKHYYQRAVTFGEEIKAYESGYYLHSLINLAQYAKDEGDIPLAKKYIKTVKKRAKRKSSAHKRAREFFQIQNK